MPPKSRARSKSKDSRHPINCKVSASSNEGWSSTIIKKADKNGICICTNKELPCWHFQHRNIKYGYRYCKGINSALTSLFYIHNETVNVWAHIIAVILLTIYTLSIIDINEFINEFGLINQLIIVIVFFIGSVFPLLCSAFCHNFYCVSKSIHRYCWFIDFLGILIAMLLHGSALVYYGFINKSYIYIPYIIFLSLFFVVSVVWCLKLYIPHTSAEIFVPCDRFPEFSFILSTYVTFASFLPLLLIFIYQDPFVKPDYYQLFLQLVSLPLIVSTGIVAFSQGGIPERFNKQLFLPENTFDIVGHSHQIWHLVSAAFMFFAINALIKHVKYTLTLQ
jgi:predicted membrane channel-forming protein YqfA (hemolysin III family)